MRYRPFGVSGKAVSCISLRLTEAAPKAAHALVFGAIEVGVNAFEIADGAQASADAVAEVLQSLERRLLFVAWGLSGQPDRPIDAHRLAETVRDGLASTGAGYFDLLTLDETAIQALTPDGEAFLEDLRSAGQVLQVAARGDADILDACIEGQTFDALASPFNLVSDLRLRRRVKEAAQRNMAVIGYDSVPLSLLEAQPEPKKGLFGRRGTDDGSGGYGFLRHTPTWTAEQICVAFALTEPSLATVQIDAAKPEDVAAIAEAADRDLPAAVAAQIEMARFGRIKAAS